MQLLSRFFAEAPISRTEPVSQSETLNRILALGREYRREQR
jgi:hypothetical protein